jgi:hypothetical protein
MCLGPAIAEYLKAIKNLRFISKTVKLTILHTMKSVNQFPIYQKDSRLKDLCGILWYHTARQTSIASSTEAARGEATSTVPASQSTLQRRCLIIQVANEWALKY